MTIFLIGALVVFGIALFTLGFVFLYQHRHPPMEPDPTTDAILIVREDGVIEFASQRAERMFGWPEGAMVGMLLNELIPARFQADHAKHVKEYFGSQSIRFEMGRDIHGMVRGPIYGRRADGEEFRVSIALAPTPLIQGKQGAVALIREVIEDA